MKKSFESLNCKPDDKVQFFYPEKNNCACCFKDVSFLDDFVKVRKGENNCLCIPYQSITYFTVD